MIRRIAATLTALVLTATTIGATPHAAAMRWPTVYAGSLIPVGKTGAYCSVSFPDPINPTISYTAAHCYTLTGERDVGAGRFRPDVVLDKTLDLIAIQLYEGVESRYQICPGDGCHTIAGLHAPVAGETVCKYGATTWLTCGRISDVWDHQFAIEMQAEPGDSGAPVYWYDTDGNIELVGILNARFKSDARFTNATSIIAISNLLSKRWGPNWFL
jgi:hypothetical protein